MLSRKSATNTRGRGGNARPPPAVTTAGRGFVEFHPSMSLENVPTLADCLSVPSTPSSDATTSSNPQPVPDANEATLDGVLADRFQLWAKVAEVSEKLAPAETYQGDVHALRKLHQLHLLCKQRETHLRTLQVTLLREGRTNRSSIPHVEVAPTIVNDNNVITKTDNSETDSEDDKDIDRPNENHNEWQQEQERHLDFVDYDAMDLIELSEQFS